MNNFTEKKILTEFSEKQNTKTEILSSSTQWNIALILGQPNDYQKFEQCWKPLINLSP